MIHEVFPVGPLQCNCSILGDEVTHEAIVVDPGGDLNYILATLAKHGLKVKQIVVTHAHLDHIAGAKTLKDLTGAPVVYNQNDLPLVAIMDEQAEWIGVPLPETISPDDSAEDGMKLSIGEIHGQVLHTPGHTEGSIVLYFPFENLLIAGDTLFAGSIGRTDLPGGDPRKIFASIKEKLMTLPEGTNVIPGHGSNTTIGEEMQENPFLVDL